MTIAIFALTRTQQELTKSSLYNMSDYVITGRPVWVRKRCPDSVTGVACYGWSQVWGAWGPGFKSWGSPIFEGASFKWDRLETWSWVRDRIYNWLTGSIWLTGSNFIPTISAYYNDIVVGAVCCRIDTTEDGRRRLYIMTLGCLAPYRRLGIGRYLYTPGLRGATYSLFQ